MMNLLFSPSGRVSPQPYFQGNIILAVAGAVLGLLPLIAPALGVIGGLLGLVLFYCFIALGIKRSHDAGKSGWMVITHILMLLLVSTIVSWVVLKIFGLDMGEAFTAGLNGDADAAAAFTQASVVPSALATLVAQPLAAYVINMLNPHDPTENQYGVVTA